MEPEPSINGTGTWEEREPMLMEQTAQIQYLNIHIKIVEYTL